jgi:energy-coupling factor transporter transmembrane protein EcfT
MIEILIALIAVTAIATFGATTGWGFFSDAICSFVAGLGFLGLILYALLCYDYFAAEHKKNIINREYGTNYTQLEVFYASGVIDTVRELERKRVEIKGDLVTGK